MEMGEQPRNKAAVENEEKRVVAGATRVSLSAIVITAVIAIAVFGWLLAR